jgi:hypothetical protein
MLFHLRPLKTTFSLFQKLIGGANFVFTLVKGAESKVKHLRGSKSCKKYSRTPVFSGG